MKRYERGIYIATGIFALAVAASYWYERQAPDTGVATYCAMEVTYREMAAGELIENSICMERVEVGYD